MRELMCLVLMALTSACWQPRYFAPCENLSGRGPDGAVTATYQFQRQDSAAANGKLRIWSGGAHARTADDGEEVVDLHVAFELENAGNSVLSLDAGSVVVEELVIGGQPQAPLPPSATVGDSFVEPGATERIDLAFGPLATFPRDVDGFQVRFSVRDASGLLLEEVTPFAPAANRRGSYGARDASWGPYDYRWGGFYAGYGYWHPSLLGPYGRYWRD